MICVTIVQESRRLALADMLNAAMLGADLVEVRLDKFEKDANLTEIVAARRKPVLFSCRRPQDGGQWSGTEDERLTLLRSAVIAKADYVEVELDAADQIRPFPGCKRVVSYTNLSETPKDIDAIYQDLQTKKPDIIKVTCKADSPEQAWPLVHLLNKPPVPTIVEARGPAGTLLTLVGRKVGAPWTTAAMERGMEAFAGQPTVRDLIDIYRYGDIGKKTRFVGVTGDGERSRLACGLFNAAFAHASLPHQALPMDMGSRRLFKKVADAIRLQSVLLDESQYEGLHEIAKLDETVVSPVLAGDGLTPGESEWTAFNALGPAVAAAVLDIYRERDGSANLKGRIIALAGCGVPTRMVAMPLKAAGASLLWASRDRNAVQAASQAFGGRQVIWEALYATSHDVLVIGRDGTKADNSSDKPLHPGYLKSGMVVVDLTAGLHPSKFLQEAEARGCRIVTPGRLLVEQVREHVRRLGAEVPAAVLMEKLTGWLPEE
jgi:3-dehydroquinate dehydratase / shikimate dehydrogenase